MFAEKSTIRVEVLFIEGTLTLFLGLALLYLQGVIKDVIFDVVAVVIALVLCAGIFFMIAIVDFLAAASSGIRRLRDVGFYTMLGLAFAVGGLLLVLGPPDVTNVLLALVIVHGLASGFLGIVAAERSSFPSTIRAAFYGFATASIAISGIVAALARSFDDWSALGWVGFYLCLVGVKMLFLAGCFQYQALHAARLPVASVEKSVQ
jgi:hypothetical protein